MNLPANELIILTREQRKGNAIVTAITGLVVAIIIQFLASIPGQGISNIGWREIYDNASTIAMILFVILFCFFIEKRKPKTLGFFTKNVRQNYILGLLAGFIFITIVFLLNTVTGAVSINMDFSAIKWWFIIFSFVGFFIQGLMEEVICRGFIMNTLASRYGVIAGIISNSIIFSLLHGFASHYNWLPAINLFLIGILFSFIFYYTGSIFVVGAIHTAWNFVVGPVYGIQVSGIPAYSAIINTTPKTSHSLLNGGSFGIEGGLLMTIATLLFIGIVIYSIKNKPWEQMIK